MTDTQRLTFEQMQNLRKWANAREKFLFPWLDETYVTIWVLSQNDITICTIQGRKKAIEAHGEKVSAGEVDNFIQRELFFRCVFTEDGEETFFKSAEEAGKLTMDECTMFLEYYTTTQEKYWVDKKIISEEDLMTYLEAVKKASPLGMSLSTHTLRELVLFLDKNSTTSLRGNDTTSTDSNEEEKKLSKKWWVKSAELKKE